MAENERSYRFGEFRLDPAAARLVRGEQDIELPPKAFQVLAYLVEHRERVVPKQQLVETIWRDTFVTDDALVQAITTIRRALGDSAEEPRFIRTRPRVGYQFIAPVRSDSQPVSTARPAVPTSIAPIGRTGARRLMITIQAGYLALYSIALFQLEVAAGALATTLPRPAGLAAVALPLLVVLALVGVTVRLYLITAVALDHPQTGRQYARIFPGVFLLDILWAFSPLLLAEDTGLPLALALIPVLAYGPFAQRTLIRSAYHAGASAR